MKTQTTQLSLIDTKQVDGDYREAASVKLVPFEILIATAYYLGKVMHCCAYLGYNYK
jgi:hypothetical protein